MPCPDSVELVFSHKFIHLIPVHLVSKVLHLFSKDLLTHCTASCGLLHGDGTIFQGDHGGLSNRCVSLGLALMIKARSDHRSLRPEYNG